MAQEMLVSMKFTATGEEASAQILLLESQFKALQASVEQANVQLKSFGGTGFGTAITSELKVAAAKILASRRALATENAAIAQAAANAQKHLAAESAATLAATSPISETERLQAKARKDEQMVALTAARAQQKADFAAHRAAQLASFAAVNAMSDTAQESSARPGRNQARAEAENAAIDQRMGKVHAAAEKMNVTIKQQQDLWQGARDKEMAAVGGDALAAGTTAMEKYGFAVGDVLTVSQKSTIQQARDIEMMKVHGDSVQAGAAAMQRLGLAYGELGPHVHGSALAIREFLVMMRELSRGDMTRFAGSLSIFLGTFKNFSLLNLATNPITLVAAAMGALTYAAVKGSEAQTQFNNVLVESGNYAGMTEAKMNSLAETISKTSTMTIGAAKEVVTQLVASGQIGSQSLAAIAGLAEKMSERTGKSVDETTALLVKLFSDPIKGAEELNKTMHFLNGTEQDHIRVLAESGDMEGARLELAKKTEEAQKGITNALKDQDDWWDRITKSASAAVIAMEKGAFHILRPSKESPQDKLAAAVAALDAAQNPESRRKAGLPASQPELIDKLQTAVEAAQKEVRAENAVLAAKQKVSEQNAKDAEINAHFYSLQTGAIQKAQNEINGYDKDIAAYAERMKTARGKDLENLQMMSNRAVEVKKNEQHNLENLQKSLTVHVARPDTLIEDMTGANAANATKRDLNSMKNGLEEVKKLREAGIMTYEQQAIYEIAIAKMETEGKIKQYDIEIRAARERAAKLNAANKGSGNADTIRMNNLETDKAIAQENLAFENSAKLIDAKIRDEKKAAEDAKKAFTDAIDSQVSATHGVVTGLSDQRAAVERKPALTSYQKSSQAYDIAMKEAEAQQKLIDGLTQIHTENEAENILKMRAIDTESKARNRMLATQVVGYTQLNSLITSGLDKFMTDMTKGGAHLKTLFRDLFASIVQGIDQILTQDVSQKMAEAMGFGNSPRQSSGMGGLLGGFLQTALGFGGATPTTNIAGTSIMGNMSTASAFGPVATLAVGTDYVPQDMLAMIHKGEQVVPAAYNTRGSAASTHVTNVNNFTLNEPTNTRTQSQVSAQIAAATRNAARRNS